MKTLSLKLREDIFDAVEGVVHAIHTSRNAYINEALGFYTRLMRRKLLRRQLKRESAAVRDDSLAVLEAFEKFQDDLPA